MYQFKNWIVAWIYDKQLIQLNNWTDTAKINPYLIHD